MNTSDVLNKAADLIERDGWATGTNGMLTTGPHCLEGAIQAVMGTVRPDQPTKYDCLVTAPCPAGNAVHRYLDLHRIGRVYEYNDAPGRTATEVVEVLRACAVIEASRERESAEVSA